MSAAREQARLIWQAGVDAVRPEPLMRAAFTTHADLREALAQADQILVLGAGKAGAAMAAATEEILAEHLERISGWINVPAGTEAALQRIHLHPARPAGSNQPTAEGVRGTREVIRLAQQGAAGAVGLCLLSGGGSALLPAPAAGVTLEDKQDVTRRLHACGATIQEMNAVRKHLSDVKGGRLAQAFHGAALFSLIISDVIGDPLDVIASGPTAADPTTFADALEVLDRFGLRGGVSTRVIERLEAGRAGRIAETAKAVPGNVHNLVIGNNRTAFDAAWRRAEELGFRVRSLGQPISGEAASAAREAATAIRAATEPTCFIGGGETTVTLAASHGKGGRNQEWVLALLCELGEEGMRNVTFLSGGTDGEDGPTDAAGALADQGTWERARRARVDARMHLDRHDAYAFFQATDDLLITGLTNTNVMDLQVVITGERRGVSAT